MAGPSYVIDGYNLLHRLPCLAELLARDMEQARDRLVGLISGWKAGKTIAVTVVFDGTGGTFSPPRSSSGVKVVFSRPPSDADAHIKNLVAKHARPRSLTVVTSDNAVLKHVRDCGARTLGSDEFSRILSSSTCPQAAPRPEERDLSADEVEDWRHYFLSRRPEEQNIWTPGRRKPPAVGR